MSKNPKTSPSEGIKFKQHIEPRSINQSAYLESIQRNTFTFGVGNPGTGKTVLAVWQAILEISDPKSRINRIIIVRPVIENKFGESLGALPGDIMEKMLPFAGSIIDNLSVFLDRETINKLIYDGTIEFIPLTLLRGRSFNNAFVIVEEAQNIRLSGKGVYMVMSRLGNNSKMVLNGDLRQSDLGEEESALKNAIDILRSPTLLKDVGVVELYDPKDVQRHKMLYRIMERFGETGELNNNPFN